jgi:hypothetical protein
MRQLRQRLPGPDAATGGLSADAVNQLIPLVQQAQDGTLALRNRPSGSLLALDISMEQFRAEADELARLLVRPGQKPLADRLAEFSESWPQSTITLPTELLEEIYRIGLDLQLYDQRNVLLARLPNEVQASLRRSQAPNAQMYLDIVDLSMKTGHNGEPLLAQWLRTAALLHIYDEKATNKLKDYARDVAALGTSGEDAVVRP